MLCYYILENQIETSVATKKTLQWSWGLPVLALISGIYSPNIAAAIWSIAFIVALFRQDHEGLLLAFLMLLIFSDSRSHNYDFAELFKNVVAPFFGLYCLYSFGGFSRNQLIYGFFPFFLFAFIITLLNDDPFLSFQKTFSYFLIFASIPSLISTLDISFFRKYFFLVIAVLLFGVLLNFINPEFTQIQGRYRGMLGNPNGLGIFLVLNFLLFQLVVSKSKNLFTRRENIFFSLLFLYSLFLCQSRSAIVVFALFFLFRFLFLKSKMISWISLLLFIPVYSYLEQNLPLMLIEYGLGEYFRVDTLAEGSGRTIAWTFAWEQLQNNFFIGKGFAYTENLFNSYYVYLSKLGHQGNAHNSFLTIWLDTGLIGLILFMFPFFSLFVRGNRLNSYAFPILICILFAAFFESWLAASLNPFTIVFLIIVTMLLKEEKTDNKLLDEA